MKNLRVVCVFVAVVVSHAQAQSPASSAGPAAAEIRQILVDRIDERHQSIGIVVGVVGPEGRRVVAYGKAAEGDSRPLDGDSVFEIGSVTKVFTSLLLADMAARREVALTDPVSKFLPAEVKVPERDGHQITLQDLATHTSGLPRLPGNLVASLTNPYADYSVEQLYRFLSSVQLSRPIGAQYEYSNLAVGLLGVALTRRASTGYESLVTARILSPLGLSHTRVTLSENMRARLTTGHDQNLKPVPAWEFSPAFAGTGGLYSTANDLLTFLEATLGFTRSALAPAMAATVAVRRKALPDVDIGLGWHISTVAGRQIVWHGGGTAGHTTFVAYDPRARRGVVVLSNAFTTNGIDDIGRHLLDPTLPLSQAPGQRKAAPVDPTTLDLYVGRYQVAPNFVLTITRQGDHLFGQAPGQAKFELFLERDHIFFLKLIDAQVTFETDGRSPATCVIWHQGGQNTLAQRITGDVAQIARPERKVVSVDPQRLDSYVGRYQLAPTMILTITREGERLLAQATGQGKFEIFPESDTSFFAKVADIQITFEVDEQNGTAGIILHQSGASVRAKRIE